MSFPTSPLRALRRVQPTTWLLLSGFASLCIVGGLIVATTTLMLRAASERAAVDRMDAKMRVAWHLLHELGPEVRLVDGRLYVGTVLLNGNDAAVDRIRDLVGGTATIFQNDVRVSTNVLDADGKRALGTRLAAGPARNTVLNLRERFRGAVDVLGTRYYAAYDPMFDGDGTLVGILYVGTPEAQILGVVSHDDMIVVGIPSAAILLVGAFFLLVGRKLAQQIKGRQRAVERARAQLDMALASMGNGLSLWDADRRLVLFNHRLSEILSVPPGRVQTGMSYRSLFEARHAAGNFGSANLETIYAERAARVARGEAVSTIDTHRDGRVITTLYRVTADGGFVLTFEDVTERHAAAAKIAFMAHYDALTGLGNRVLFDQRLQGALNEAALAGRRVAVLGLDLDRFKPVNDTLGHAVGDQLLVLVAKRLGALLRSTDTLARLGGDEFAVVLPLGGMDTQPCDVLAERIVRQLSEPFTVDEHSVVVGVSVGVALYPDHGDTSAELLRCADIAMYSAKDGGRGRHCLFDPSMDEQLQKRRALERDLRQAIAAEGLALHYQPLVCCASGRVEGYEALLRWDHPRHGPISPAVFVPLAEETNLILPLGQWVLETACRAAAGWAEPARVAVNLSPAQFRQPDLTALVLGTLARTGLPPSRLEVEITEGVLIDEPSRAMAMLGELRAAGVRVSLDDFGTGYSSLSYLRQFPLDKIKIDKSFIDTMTVDPQAASIVRALVSLAHTLHLSVTAEGVETVEQLRALQAQLCNQVQGYLVGRPAPVVGAAAVMLPAGTGRQGGLGAAAEPDRVLADVA